MKLPMIETLAAFFLLSPREEEQAKHSSLPLSPSPRPPIPRLPRCFVEVNKQAVGGARQCVQEGRDGEAIGGGARSIIHQAVRLIYLPPQGAERDLPSGSACSHFHLSFFSASVLLLLRMDECERAARNPPHPSPQHWQSRLPSASLSDAARRLRASVVQEGRSASWLRF